MRVFLVINPASRRGLRQGPAVRRALHGLGVDFLERDDGSPIDAVVAAGGDGTALSVLTTAIARGVPLGIVPLGTFNDLARTLGVPLDVEPACALIAARHTRAIDLGSVNGAYFVNEASIGISARIARRQTPEIKQRFGSLGVVAAALQSLPSIRPFSVQLSFDGEREQFRTIQLTVANSGRFGGVIERNDAGIDDGWLDLYSIEAANLWHALRIGAKVAARNPRSSQELRTRRAREFAIYTRRRHRIAADGEPAGTTPAVFRIVPKAVRVIVPKLAVCATEISGTPASNSPSSDLAPG